jgi:Cu2+-containing amine oxidase
VPSPLEAADGETPFNGGVEGGLAWDAERFRTVLVEDASTNAHGRRRGYELVPFRTGTARHLGADERFTRSDFWVTRWTAATSWMSDWQPPDEYLFGSADGRSGIANRQPIAGQDLVLWHLSSAHHEPHDEDQAEGGAGFEGVTLVHWMGADLVPHDLFDHNPLGGPHRDQCKP